MGQGGYLKIVNASPYTLRLVHIHSYQMNAWDNEFPRVIRPGECPRVYIEWCENIFKVWSDDAGEARYEIVGTNPVRHFEIQARWRYLQVDWQNTIQDPEFFPQPYPREITYLGWKHNGTITMTFCAIKRDAATRVKIEHTPPPEYIKREDINSAEEKLKTHLSNLVGVKPGETSDLHLLAKAEAQGHIKSRGDLHNLLCDALDIDQAKSVNLEVDSACAEEPLEVPPPAYLSDWMEIYGPVIGDLSLREMTLVCSHDSGTYDMVSPFAPPWASCQDIDIYNQLNYGVRVLDLRVGYQEDKSGDEKYILVHDVWRTKVTVKDALEQVKEFIRRNNKEVVILDFHRFVKLNGSFDYNGLKDLIIDTLGDLIYPPQKDGRIPTLNEIWETPGRIIVAWNRDDIPSSSFFRGVVQDWFDKTNKHDLYEAISQDMKKSHPQDRFWTVCAILTPTVFKPIRPLTPEVENWFQAGSEWAYKANIISVDLFERTSIMQQAISECLIKGVQKKK